MAVGMWRWIPSKERTITMGCVPPKVMWPAPQPRVALTFRHINETASMAVAWLQTQRVCFDAFFIDDGHKFDDIIVELFHVAKMLSFGGALMLHDNWMPSVQKVQGFIEANVPSLLHVPNPLGFKCCITIYTKVQTDQRAWNHFEPF